MVFVCVCVYFAYFGCPAHTLQRKMYATICWERAICGAKSFPTNLVLFHTCTRFNLMFPIYPHHLSFVLSIHPTISYSPSHPPLRHRLPFLFYVPDHLFQLANIQKSQRMRYFLPFIMLADGVHNDNSSDPIDI